MRTFNTMSKDGSIREPICLSCARTLGYDWPQSCEAFPKEIPLDILECIADHTKPIKGDGGKTFKPYSELTKEEIDKRFKDLLK